MEIISNIIAHNYELAQTIADNTITYDEIFGCVDYGISKA